MTIFSSFSCSFKVIEVIYFNIILIALGHNSYWWASLEERCCDINILRATKAFIFPESLFF